MDKDIGKIKKNDTTDIIIRVDEYKGKKGLTIREFITTEKYTGFSKAGTRIPPEEFFRFRELINSIDASEFGTVLESETDKEKKPKKEKKQKKIKEFAEASEESPEKSIDEITSADNSED